MLEASAGTHGLSIDLASRTATEFDPTMRRLLTTSLMADCCVFSDILEIWGDDTTSSQAAIVQCCSFEEKLLLTRRLARKTHGYCFTHDRLCPFASEAKVRVQGPPCPDFSKIGSRTGLAGPRLPALLAAGAKADAVRSAVLLLENVPEFPLDLAEAAYGPRYTWYGQLQDPSMVGFECTARPRPRALLCGSSHDVKEDVFQLGQQRQHLQGLRAGDLLQLEPAQLLNLHEAKRLQAYVEAWAAASMRPSGVCDWEDLVCHLGDNPAAGWKSWSAVSNRLPTLRRCGGLMAMPAAGRHLLLRELFASMGFPTFEPLAAAAAVPLYQVFKPLSRLTYLHQRQALGNSQVVPQVGVFAACVLASLSESVAL
ncbi:Trank1 [Symbiodinium sp. CCMP2592]|nr:Trank1 [Symbiodinium sp. CCMP2592]